MSTKEQVQGQPVLHRETSSQTNKKMKQIKPHLQIESNNYLLEALVEKTLLEKGKITKEMWLFP